MAGLLTDYPCIPIIQYHPDQPPVVPNIYVPPTVANLLGRIVSAIVNEAGAKAYASKARMHCYNVLANNYWQNPEMEEVVKMTAGYLTLRVQKREIGQPEMGLFETVSNMLTLWTGNLLLTVEALRPLVPPQHVEIALQNAAQYSQLQMEIAGIYGQQPVPHQVMQTQQNVVLVGYGPGGQPIYQQAPMVQTVMPPQTMHQQHNAVLVGYGPNGQPVYGSPNWPNQNQPQQYQPQAMIAHRQPLQGLGVVQQGQQFPQTIQVGGIDRSDGGNSNNRFGGKLRQVQIEPVQQAVQQQPAQEPAKQTHEIHVTTLGGSEVDREQHRVVNYFGKQFPMDDTDHERIASFSQPLVDDENLGQNTKTVIQSKWGLGYSQEYIELYSRMGMLKALAVNGNITVYRAYNLRLDVNLSSMPSLDKFCERIIQDIKIDTMSNRDIIATVVGNLQALVESTRQSDLSHESISEVMSLFSQVDRRLTDLVNRYLQYCLKRTTRISSFIIDGSNIVDYINGQVGVDLADDFAEYIANALKTYFAKQDDEIITSTRENLEVPDKINMTIMSINVCLTFVNLTNAELGLNVTQRDQMYRVDSNTTPNLYRLLRSQEATDARQPFPNQESYLLTKDGVRYQIFQDALNKRNYSLVLA